MRTVAGNGPEEKPRGGKRQSVAILLRAFEAAWPEVKHHLVPGARSEITRLVREVHAYTEAERLVDPKTLPRWRKQRRAKAARTKAAVPRLFEDLRILRSWTELGELVEHEGDVDPAMAFRTDAARFEAQHRPYLTRLKGRAAFVAGHREHSGSGHDYVREVVFDRLARIVETYRRDPDAPLITQDRERNDPYGVLVEVAFPLRDCLRCLPRSTRAIYRAYFRAMARQRHRSDKLIPSPGNNLSP